MRIIPQKIINHQIIEPDPRYWERSKPEIGSFLGLTSNLIDKKNSFDIFKYKLSNCVTVQLRNGRTISTMMHNKKNPTYEHNDNKPNYDATQYNSNKKIWQFEVKQWIAQKPTIKDNLGRVWIYIWLGVLPSDKMKCQSFKGF